MRVAVLFIDAQDPAVRIETVCRHAEEPLRLAELRFERMQREHFVAIDTVQVPPAAAVRYDMQFSRGRPGGLKQRLRHPCCNATRRADAPFFADVGKPQLRGVPRHVRMVPRQPRETASVGTQARRRKEIVSVRDSGQRAGIEIDCSEEVERLVTARPMVFAHGDQPPTADVLDRIGIAKAVGRRQQLGLDGAIECVDLLVRRIAEKYPARADCVGAAAILVCQRAHVQRRWHQIGGGAGRVAHQHVTSLLLRPTFSPIDSVLRDRRLTQADRIADEQSRCHGRLPGAVRLADGLCLAHRASVPKRQRSRQR